MRRMNIFFQIQGLNERCKFKNADTPKQSSTETPPQKKNYIHIKPARKQIGIVWIKIICNQNLKHF